jgi:hypothetical protein
MDIFMSRGATILGRHHVMCLVHLQEYGNGRMPKKHSTFFASMMRELGLSDEPEAYLDTVPWQVGVLRGWGAVA